MYVLLFFDVCSCSLVRYSETCYIPVATNYFSISTFFCIIFAVATVSLVDAVLITVVHKRLMEVLVGVVMTTLLVIMDTAALIMAFFLGHVHGW